MLLIGMFWLKKEIQEIPAQPDQQVLPDLQAQRVLPERRLVLEHLPLPPDLSVLPQVVLLRQRYLLSVFLLARLVQQDQQVLRGQPDLQDQQVMTVLMVERVLQVLQAQQVQRVLPDLLVAMVAMVQTVAMVRRRDSERRPPAQGR